MTCARTRPLKNQILGSDFHVKEHTKPLFKENSLLTVHNLYTYTCLLEMFKIIKLECPSSLFLLYHKSSIRPERFITPKPSTSFIYKSSAIWNTCRNTPSDLNFKASTNMVKNRLKHQLLNMQSKYDANSWSDGNFDSKEFSFWTEAQHSQTFCLQTSLYSLLFDCTFAQ